MTHPKYGHPFVGSGGIITPEWWRWVESLSRNDVGYATVEQVAADLAALAAQIVAAPEYRAGEGIRIYGDNPKYIALDAAPSTTGPQMARISLRC